LRLLGTAPAGRTLVDGKGIGDVEELVLRDRRALAATGTVVALLFVDLVTGRLTQPPDLTTVGVLGAGEKAVLDRARQELQTALNALPHSARTLPEEIADVARRHLRRIFRRELERKPVVIPLVITQ
jgi:ribonuclease J